MTAEFAKGLTPHTVLLLVDKPERTISLGPLFQKLRYKLVTSLSLYESLKLIDQEMPHLIVTDAILSDGHAGNLYDRLQQQPLFANIPILVMISAKTKEQLNPLKGRKFAGFTLGRPDPVALVQKIKETLESFSDISPFFIGAEQSKLASDCTLAIQAKVVGRIGEQMVCQSDSEVNPDSMLLCQPQDKTKGPAVLRLGSNVRRGESIYNFFPMNQVKGSGKIWIASLPEISLDQIGKSGSRRIVFYDPKMDRFEQFKRVLAGYDIELVYAPNLQAAGALMMRELDGTLGCIYLDELPSNTSGIAIKEAISKISEKVRPPVIAATTSQTVRSTREIQYIKKPFGLGMLVEMLDAALKSRCQFSESGPSHEIQYQAPARLLGLDETGGILQIKFPVMVGNKIKLQHPDLSRFWEGQNEVRIINMSRLEGSPNIWQAKFEAISAQGSKSKYWEKISRLLVSA